MAEAEQPEQIAAGSESEARIAAAQEAAERELAQMSDEELANQYKYLPQQARNQSALSFNLLPIGIALFIFFVDQVVKWYTVLGFTQNPKLERVPIIGDSLGIIYRRNPGVAFSLFQSLPWLFTILASLVVIGILIFIFFFPRVVAASTWLGVSIGLILGGAVGNLTDRLRLGYVIDMIDFRLTSLNFRWATFNIADSAVVIGGIMLFIYFMRNNRQATINQETS